MNIYINQKQYNAPDIILLGNPETGVEKFLACVNKQKEVNLVTDCINLLKNDKNIDFNLKNLILSNKFKKNKINIYYSNISFFYSNLFLNQTSLIYKENFDNLKFLCFLRNPAERAWNMHCFFREKLLEPYLFREAINQKSPSADNKNRQNIFFDYISFSLYSKSLQIFNKKCKNLLIIYHEDDDNINVHNKNTENIIKFTGIKLKKCYNEFNGSSKILNLINHALFPLYDFIFKKSEKIKKVTERILPVKAKLLMIKNSQKFISAVYIKRPKMTEEDKKNINYLYFYDDIIKLKTFSKSETINKWL